MVRKNIDIEFQALELLKSQLGHAPDVYDPNTPSLPALADIRFKTEEDTFQQVLEQSKREFETQKSFDEEEMIRLIDIATKKSLQLSKKKEQFEHMASVSMTENPNCSDTIPAAEKPEKVSMSANKKESCSDAKTTTPKKQLLKESMQQAPLVSLSPKHAAPSSTTKAASEWMQSAKNEFELTDKTIPDQTITVSVFFYCVGRLRRKISAGKNVSIIFTVFAHLINSRHACAAQIYGGPEDRYTHSRL